jgi:hypothetical protein
MAKITIKKQKELEHQFMIRMQEFGYKPDSAKYREAQSHYFVGIMLATETVPGWAICIQVGRSIYETRNDLNLRKNE